MGKKNKTAFVFIDCGSEYPRRGGQCTSCGAWNTIKEIHLGKNNEGRREGYAGSRSEVRLLSEVNLTQTARLSTGIGELDRVLGGGIVVGSVVLIGGSPGAGKSTLLLQSIANIAQQDYRVLYVSGEESLQQIAGRAHRLQLQPSKILMLAETSVQQICQVADDIQPKVLIIDSIQVMFDANAE